MGKAIIINNKKFLPGESGEVSLNDYQLPTRTLIRVPVHVFRSKKTGPVVLFTAGMHGDEINGIEIIRQLFKGEYFKRLKCGSVIAMPVINIVSFLNKSRELPDGRDLNRCFPGSRSGSLGSRLAHDLMTRVLPTVTCGIDFHTGGAKINNYPQVRCVFDDKKSLELAKLTGANYILDAPYRDKTFRKEAASKGKSILVYEAGESGRFNKTAIEEGIHCCLRLLNNLNMLNEKTPENSSVVLNSSKWVRAKIPGLFRTWKKWGAFVEKGDVLGIISDPFGTVEEELISPVDGFLIGINNQPVVNEGDALMHIGVDTLN